MTSTVELIVEVDIEIRGGVDPYFRVVGPEGDEFREHFYPFVWDRDDVNRMFANAALLNGVIDASKIDGWADLNEGDVTMRIVDVA